MGSSPRATLALEIHDSLQPWLKALLSCFFLIIHCQLGVRGGDCPRAQAQVFHCACAELRGPLEWLSSLLALPGNQTQVVRLNSRSLYLQSFTLTLLSGAWAVWSGQSRSASWRRYALNLTLKDWEVELEECCGTVCSLFKINVEHSLAFKTISIVHRFQAWQSHILQ